MSSTARTSPPLLLLGTDHRTAPLPLRERVSYDAEQAEEALIHLLAREEIAEASLLSTCNRTEVYLLPRVDDDAYRVALERVFLAREPEMGRAGRLYVKRGEEASRHLLRVAAGLESMVLGEPEILGQVKQAATLAEAVGSSGTILRRLTAAAAAAGARARRDTEIAGGAVSLGYAVAELARNIYSRLDRTRVLMVGAGDTARSVARSLLERDAREVTVVNRSPEGAERLRTEIPHLRVRPWEEMVRALAAADVVVTTTSAQEPILTAPLLDRAAELPESESGSGGGGRALLIVDLGVPRNVEPEVGDRDTVFLHTVDSLEALIDRNLRRRREEVPAVEELIEAELARFHGWYRTLEAEPLVARLQKQAEAIRAAEIERFRSHFPAESHDSLDRITRSLVRKLLHHPSARLRGKHGDDDGPPLAHLDLVRELFQLDREGADDADGEPSTVAEAAGEEAGAEAGDANRRDG